MTLARQNKTIITCAVTGAIHTPTMSDALPYTYNDIATQAVDAAEAGASILHLHARNPEDGSPSVSPDDFVPFLARIKQATDAVVNISTGGSLTLSIQDRVKPAKTFSPEMCSLNMGSMNFSFHPLAKRYEEWKFDWEKDYVAGSDGNIFRNTFRDIKEAADTLAPHDIKFEHECYDVGHLYNLAHFLDRGLVQPPLFVQTIFGILGGIGADPENLTHMKRIADKLFGNDFQWSVLAAGRHQLGFVSMAAILGGNVRVGLEDSLYAGKGRLAGSNAEQVAIVRSILEGLSLEVASADEADVVLTRAVAGHVRHLVVGGRDVLRNGRLATLDLADLESELMARARKEAAVPPERTARDRRRREAVRRYYAENRHLTGSAPGRE